MLKKNLCGLLFLSSFSFVFAAAVTTVNFDFTRQRVVSPYPPGAAAHLLATEEGYVMRKNASLESLVGYFYVQVPAGAKSMRFALTYRNSSGAVPQLSASFNKPGGGNGSNGYAKANFLPSAEWRTHIVLLTVPEGTAAIQCVLGASGNDFELAFSAAQVTFFADVFAVTRAPVGFDPTRPPEQWQEMQDMPGFYRCVTAEPASEQTDVKMTFNEQNLYVGMVAHLLTPEKLLAKVDDQQPDAAIFNDDCLELFLSSPERSLAWQFALNPNGSRFDAEVKQNMPGDPWRVFKSWNGDWQAHTFRTAKNWQASFVIPWKTLGFQGMPANPLGFNAGRENKSGNENSQWNAYDGNFHAVDKYAILDLQRGQLERSRRIDRASYLIERPNQQFEALLSQELGNFRTGTWGVGLLSSFPEKVKQLYTPEEELAWQEALMQARGEAGMMGPPLPWACWNLKGGWDKMTELRQKHGTTFPYVLFNSAVSKGAIKGGAKYFYGESGVDPACDGYREYVLNSLEELKTKGYYQNYLDHVGLVFGIDEPTNQVPNVFSRTRNTAMAEALNDADAEIKGKTGFGKFGLYDAFAEPTENVEFERIAFWRWWNGNFARFCQEVQAKVKEVFPGMEFKSIDRNTVSGVCTVDVALLSPYSDWISCDPYPTSTSANYGLGRALYHVGFSAKMLGDLAAQTKLCVTPQNFIYHGGRPEPDEIREWASQCLKVGAEMLYWYIEDAETLMNMWDGNLEVLSINKQLTTLPKLQLPRATGTAVLHSDYDRWGLMDNVLHAAYSLHVLLGEQTQAWFQFISPTGMDIGLHDLESYRVVYVPRMKFTDPKTTARIMSFVQGGGTLVVFDPEVFTNNIDGSQVPERQSLVGANLVPREMANPQLNYQTKALPVYKVLHLPGKWQGKYQAYDFQTVPIGAKILATYADDGKPAIIERQFGKGKVIFSAVQPFGNSEVALQKTAWVDFVQEICRQVKEPMGLPIWDFVLKRFPENKVELNLQRKW